MKQKEIFFIASTCSDSFIHNLMYIQERMLYISHMNY